jgi:hypothetical protein
MVGPWQAHGEDEDASLLKLADTPRARSAATLVVAAVTLLPQWEAELKRHAPSLKVGPPPPAMHTSFCFRSPPWCALTLLFTTDLVVIVGLALARAAPPHAL